MDIHVHHTFHVDDRVLRILQILEQQGVQLMALSAAQQAQLETLKMTIDTLATGLRSDVQALKDAIVAAPAADPAVTAAFNDLAARLVPLQALDAETPGGAPVAPINQV